VLERNPYWPSPFSGNVDQVNIIHFDDETSAFQMWEDRLLDISPVPAPDQDGIFNQYNAKSVFVPEQAIFYLAYNFESAAFSLPEVRQAFGMAINRERLVREVHNDRGLPMRHLGPPGTVGAPPIDQVGSGYSPDRARQLMDSSPFGDCRLLPEITYLVSSSDQALQQAELLREMWVDELDCKEDQIKIEQVQFGTLLANTRPDAGSIRPDIWDLGWAAYFPDEDNWLGQVAHCKQSENRQNRPCSQVDELIAAADVTTDLDERWELYRQAERGFFGEDGLEPLTPLYVRGEYFVKQGWLHYTPAIFGGEQFDKYILDPEQKNLEQLRLPLREKETD
jgi:ABC-type oligopeptide transport system substrate-binding subunit